MFFNPCENIMFVCCTLMLMSHFNGNSMNSSRTDFLCACTNISRAGLAPSPSLSIVIHRITILSHRKCIACQNFWAFHHRALCVDTTALTHSRNNHEKKSKTKARFFLPRSLLMFIVAFKRANIRFTSIVFGHAKQRAYFFASGKRWNVCRWKHMNVTQGMTAYGPVRLYLNCRWTQST